MLVSYNVIIHILFKWFQGYDHQVKSNINYTVKIHSRGGNVQLFHGSVCSEVLESWFQYGSVCLGKNLVSN